jgi:hypothetical protein
MRSPATSSTSEPFLFAIQVCLADLPERRRSKTLLGNRCTSRSLRATAGDCDHLRRDPTQEVAGSSPARSTSGASRRTRRADLLFACARQPLTTPGDGRQVMSEVARAIEPSGPMTCGPGSVWTVMGDGGCSWPAPLWAARQVRGLALHRLGRSPFLGSRHAGAARTSGRNGGPGGRR